MKKYYIANDYNNREFLIDTELPRDYIDLIGQDVYFFNSENIRDVSIQDMKDSNQYSFVDTVIEEHELNELCETYSCFYVEKTDHLDYTRNFSELSWMYPMERVTHGDERREFANIILEQNEEEITFVCKTDELKDETTGIITKTQTGGWYIFKYNSQDYIIVFNPSGDNQLMLLAEYTENGGNILNYRKLYSKEEVNSKININI